MTTQTPIQRDRVMNQVRFFNKRVTNQIMMRFAGKHIYAVIHHAGRKSGKPYQTPVVAMPYQEGFVIPLPYDPNVDWCRNVFAAGSCVMDWQSRRYQLESPECIPPDAALPAFPAWMRGLLRRTRVYLYLTRAGAPKNQSGPDMQKILVYGAGVLGSIYAAKLQQAGYDVTLLARGSRLEELRQNGLVLVEARTDREERVTVKLADRLAPEDAYDLVMVVVRKNQLPSVLPALAKNHCTPNVLFLINNAAGPDAMVSALGKERVLLGFPGGGGRRENGAVHYQLSTRIGQPTTIGELSGETTPRVQAIASVLEASGLPAAISPNMDAWLKTHVAVVSPVANALYLAGESNYRLAQTPDGLVLMVRAVREGLRVLKQLHIPITPPKIRALEWLPEPLLVALLKRRLATEAAELVLSQHANAARDEMSQLSEEFQVLARESGLATPAIDRLAAYIDPAVPPLPEGQSTLPLDWRPTARTALFATMLAALGWLVLRKTRPVK